MFTLNSSALICGKECILRQDQNRKRETDGEKQGSRGNHSAKNKPKETFLGSVKETLDALKTRTKEFVRRHKEKN